MFYFGLPMYITNASPLPRTFCIEEWYLCTKSSTIMTNLFIVPPPPPQQKKNPGGP